MKTPTSTISLDQTTCFALVPRLQKLADHQRAEVEKKAAARKAENDAKKAAYRWYRPSTWFFEPEPYDYFQYQWFTDAPLRQTEKHIKAFSADRLVMVTIPVDDYNDLMETLNRFERQP